MGGLTPLSYSPIYSPLGALSLKGLYRHVSDKHVDDFVRRIHELQSLELDEEEWEAIERVAEWLKTFRLANSQMSGTKGLSTLSTTHIFRGLQEHVADIIRFFPASSHPKIKDGLLNAHCKLSNYYYKYDQSPFHTWSACKPLKLQLSIVIFVD